MWRSAATSEAPGAGQAETAFGIGAVELRDFRSAADGKIQVRQEGAACGFGAQRPPSQPSCKNSEMRVAPLNASPGHGRAHLKRGAPLRLTWHSSALPARSSLERVPRRNADWQERTAAKSIRGIQSAAAPILPLV